MNHLPDEYYMEEALKEANLAFEADEVPVGAVVVVNGKIIARGHNQVELLNDSTAHAESHFIRNPRTLHDVRWCTLLG
jgi:tRNA(Arg) A34 adenosine deaminase TadA